MLSVDICGVKLKNPVITASGIFSFGEEYNEYYDVSKLGAIASSGITINPKPGNDGIRLHEVTGGMINSIGLQNPGIAEFIKTEYPKMKGFGTVTLANLGGATIEEYVEGMKLLNDTDIELIELNISCPNVKEGGVAFGIKCEPAYKVVKEIKAISNKPVIVKLSPNAENIVEVAKRCVDAGADGISLVNTFKAMAIDIDKRRPVFNNVSAGLSGPAIKPMALSMVYEVAAAVDVPIIGMGGIMNWKDAIEFIMAGADAIQVGSANFIKPDVSLDIINGIENYMKREGIKSLSEIKGIAHR